MRLDEQRVGAVMTPRTDLIWLDVDATKPDIENVLREQIYSVYPVAQENADQIIGVVRTKDLVLQLIEKGEFDLRATLLTPIFLPESVPIADALSQFKRTGMHTALVLDEYGGIAGIVRMHDLIEPVVGKLDGGMFAAQEAEAVQRDDGSWLLDGQINLYEMGDIFPDFAIPEDERGEYETLAGFIMARLERIPSTSDNFVYGDLHFEVSIWMKIGLTRFSYKNHSKSPEAVPACHLAESDSIVYAFEHIQ